MFSFSRTSASELKFLQSVREKQMDSDVVKKFLVDSIRSDSWYVCYKLSKYTNLHRLYRHYWLEIAD